jgi:hypothetical protein
MDFRCEDLPQHGLRLVAPSSPDYAPALADLRCHLDQPMSGTPPIPGQFRTRISEEDRSTSAILLNQNKKTIAALQVVWRFETISGHTPRHSSRILSPQVLLLPFGKPESSLKPLGYWHAILPGSKRYLSQSGMVGDNTDVRLPSPEEKWPSKGGVVAIGRSGGMDLRDPVKQITLTLDGIFFLDGEFVGPNREALYEETVAEAEAHTLVAKIAREGHNSGRAPSQILAEIEKTTGPAQEEYLAPPGARQNHAKPEEFRQWALQQLAEEFAQQREFPQYSDENLVVRIMGWTETVLPHFRKVE